MGAPRAAEPGPGGGREGPEGRWGIGLRKSGPGRGGQQPGEEGGEGKPGGGGRGAREKKKRLGKYPGRVGKAEGVPGRSEECILGVAR